MNNMETVVHCNVEKNARLIAQILDFDDEGMEYDWYEQHIDLLAKNLEPKRGEWIGKSDDDSLVKCSVCGHIRIGSSLWYCKQYVPYCENCGAKMEVQDGQA